jgi:hypothetical protein
MLIYRVHRFYHMKHIDRYIYTQFPASSPCTCKICISFCKRPGWWLVSEARDAIVHGYANRMMLELSPNHSFGVLSPAFKGNEGYLALLEYSDNYCTFLENDRCTIFGKTFQPIECRFCHHDRIGLGKKCHYAIEKDWNSSKGKRLVNDWLFLRNLNSFHLF